MLAYSTVSQLGFMFVAVGTGLYVAAIFHMITHAFFKALLFLGAGSVIHGMDGEQDMRRYGALRKAMPITSATFIVGWLAISGVPPFSGFWSKDEVLLSAYNDNIVLWVLLLIAAILTAFYMSRLVFMTFFGDARWNDPIPAAAGPGIDTAVGDDTEDPDEVLARDDSTEHADHHEVHPHESPWLMWVPLVVLAGSGCRRGRHAAAVQQGRALPGDLARARALRERGRDHRLRRHEVDHRLRGHRRRARRDPDRGSDLPAPSGRLRAPSSCRSSPEAGATTRPSPRSWADRAGACSTWPPGSTGRIIDGVVVGVGRVTETVGTRLRATQTGLVRTYALGVVVGTIVLVTYFVTRTSF